MKLALKLIVSIGFVILGVHAVFGYITLERELQIYDSDMRRDARQLGLFLREMMERAWMLEGQERAIHLVNLPPPSPDLPRTRWCENSEQPHSILRSVLDPVQVQKLKDGEYVASEVLPYRIEGVLRTFVPVFIEGKFQGAIEIEESHAELATMSRAITLRIVYLTIAMMVISGGTLLTCSWWILAKPLTKLREHTHVIGAGDYQTEIHLDTRDELEDLASSMNAMCHSLIESQARVQAETMSRIAALEQLRHADRLKTVGRLAAGVAHELGTPLNVISGHASMMHRAPEDQKEIGSSAKTIIGQVEKMTSIIRQLLDFARRRHPNQSHGDVYLSVEKTIGLLRKLAQAKRLELVLDPESQHVHATFDASQIEQVVTNLIVNAIQASREGGQVSVAVRQVVAEDTAKNNLKGDYVRISVMDAGCGISEENIHHVFEPFFTTKDVGEGTGLGLSISYGIINEHGGWIDVNSRIGAGATFSVYLPLT